MIDQLQGIISYNNLNDERKHKKVIMKMELLANHTENIFARIITFSTKKCKDGDIVALTIICAIPGLQELMPDANIRVFSKDEIRTSSEIVAYKNGNCELKHFEGKKLDKYVSILQKRGYKIYVEKGKYLLVTFRYRK